MDMFATPRTPPKAASHEPTVDVPPTIGDQVLTVLPALNAYAGSLTRNLADSQDLVHDAVVSMLASAAQFRPGTNFRAWAFTILRNRFLTVFARRRPTVCLDDVDTTFASTRAAQTDRLELWDLRDQVALLPAPSRDLLALVADGNRSYQTIAGHAGTTVGTIKSRVHRSRATLRGMMRSAYGEPEGQRGRFRSVEDATASGHRGDLRAHPAAQCEAISHASWGVLRTELSPLLRSSSDDANRCGWLATGRPGPPNRPGIPPGTAAGRAIDRAVRKTRTR